MKRYELRNDKGNDIAFTGELIASVDSRDFRRAPGVPTRWTELRLYETRAGKFICEICGRATNPGEVDRFQVKVANNEREVFRNFKSTYLSKALFDEAGLTDAPMEVE